MSRNEAVPRLEAIIATGADPGTKAGAKPPIRVRKLASASTADEPEPPDADDSAIDLEQYAQARIEAVIQEQFKGHGMAVLVEALLRVAGHTCWRAPEGADGGIDLLAGSGPLGLDEPRLGVRFGLCGRRGSRSRKVARELGLNEGTLGNWCALDRRETVAGAARWMRTSGPSW